MKHHAHMCGTILGSDHVPQTTLDRQRAYLVYSGFVCKVVHFDKTVILCCFQVSII